MSLVGYSMQSAASFTPLNYCVASNSKSLAFTNCADCLETSHIYVFRGILFIVLNILCYSIRITTDQTCRHFWCIFLSNFNRNWDKSTSWPTHPNDNNLPSTINFKYSINKTHTKINTKKFHNTVTACVYNALNVSPSDMLN